MTFDLSHQLFWIIVEAAVCTAVGVGFLIDYLQKHRLTRHARSAMPDSPKRPETSESHTL